MIRACKIPGLFITGTDTGVGKTVVAAAIAAHLRKKGKRLAVCKPIATGCLAGSNGLISEDAQLLERSACSRFAMEMICPQRYAEPLAPAVAAQRESRPVDWDAIDRAIGAMCAASDAIIVEGVGGVMVPLDHEHMVIDMIRALALPALIVSRPGLGTINHTLLTLQALRSADIPIAGVIINRMPASPDLAERTNADALEKFGRCKVIGIIPDAGDNEISQSINAIMTYLLPFF